MPSRPESVLRHCEIPGSDLSVTLEDDARVAYAYLQRRGEIVSDVWLYNVEEPPDESAWQDKTQLPFLNPRKYCKQVVVERITQRSKISCTVVSESVEVRIDDKLIARLKPGVKPGWSKFAAIDSPLARPLDLLNTQIPRPLTDL
jgi:hypothetical protein